MRYDHSGDSFSKFVGDIFAIEYDFTNSLNGRILATPSSASIFDSNGVDRTASMLASKAVVSPDITFTIFGGTVGELYEIKLLGKSTVGDIYTQYINCEVYGDITLNSKLGDPSANSYCSITQANEYILNKYGHSTTWDDLTVEGKKRILIQATKDIDLMSFRDSKYYKSQALEFPRHTHTIVTGACATPFTINSFTNAGLYSDTYMEYPTDFWKYGTCHITEGTPLNDIRSISTSNYANGRVTMSSNFTATPNANTEFIIFTPLDKEILASQCEQALYIINSSSMSELDTYRNKSAKEVRIGDVMVQFSSSADKRYNVLSKESKSLLSSYLEFNYKVARC
jgi:hypothetical protein